MTDAMHIAIAGGGTGGHIFPGIALADAIRRRRPDAQILFLGSEGGLEERVLEDSPYPLALLPSPRAGAGGLRRIFGVPGQAARLARATARAHVLLKSHNAAVVVGTGGYASAAPLIAARLRGLPTVLLEQNAIPGRTNRMLARWATEVHTQYAESVPLFPDPSRVEVSGNPVRRRILEAGVCSTHADGSSRPVLLVLGGSQGARAINRAVSAALPAFRRDVPEIEILHLTGQKDFMACSGALAASGIEGRVLPFCDDMAALYRKADLVLCRAGATSLAEIAALGLPSILVPYPHAADNHQEANAKILVDAGAAVRIPEADLPACLAESVIRLLRDSMARSDMARAAAAIGRPDAAETIAARVEALASRRSTGRTRNAQDTRDVRRAA